MSTPDQLKQMLENAANVPGSEWFSDAIKAYCGENGIVLVKKARAKKKLKKRNYDNIVRIGPLTEENIRLVLRKVALEHDVITYKGLVLHFGEWPNDRFHLITLLGRIAEDDFANKIPFSCSLVVHEEDERCGEGLVEKVASLGVNVDDKEKFEDNERSRVYDYWSGRAEK